MQDTHTHPGTIGEEPNPKEVEAERGGKPGGGRQEEELAEEKRETASKSEVEQGHQVGGKTTGERRGVGEKR